MIKEREFDDDECGISRNLNPRPRRPSSYAPPSVAYRTRVRRPSPSLIRRAIALAAGLVAFAVCTPVASAYIYWTNNGPGLESNGTTIGRADLDGSGATESMFSTAPAPGPIISEGSHIYWGDAPGVSGDAIGRANLDGSGASQDFIPTPGGLFAIATDGTYIYWTDGTRYVGRASINGTGVDAQFIDMGSQEPFGIAASGGILYIGEDGRIMSAPSNGGSPPSVFASISGQFPLSLAVANGYVYWAASPGNAIGRVLTDGADLDESYVPGLQFPTGVATDGNELYWADKGAGAIGRATIGSPGPTDVQPAFISDADGPWGVAFDSAIDATSTTVTCNPPSGPVGSISACTATIGDSASTSVPTGNVVFSGGSAYFSGGNACTVTARPGGGASCTVAAASLGSGTQPITASYSGDAVHAPSSGLGGFCTGTAAQCSGSVPVGHPPACRVPKLKGKTLATARRLLAAAHCRLGGVARPRARKGHPLGPFVVGSERPGTGTVLPNDAKVGVRLIARVGRRHR